MIKIGITGISCKTTLAFILEDAILRQGKSVFSCVTWQFRINGVAFVKDRLYTTPHKEEYDNIKDSMHTCDVCIFEASSESLADNRASVFKPIDAAVITTTAGYSTHYTEHNSHIQYLLTKARIFSLVKPNGISIFPEKTQVKEACVNYSAHTRTLTFNHYNMVELANLVLINLGFEPNARQVQVPGRWEYVTDNIVIDKALQGISTQYVLANLPGTEVVIVHPYRVRKRTNIAVDEPLLKALENDDRVKRIFVYPQYSKANEVRLTKKRVLCNTRKEAVISALNTKNHFVAILGSGNQPYVDGTDFDLVKQHLKG